MDSSYIIPFIKSVRNLFETMLQMPVQVASPKLNPPGKTDGYDISGLIGLSGDIEGVVAVSFPEDTAKQVVARFAGVALETSDDDFADAIGELVNMISGGAKAQLEGKDVSISCPSVIIGTGHVVVNPLDVVRIVLPCQTEVGNFEVEVALKKSCLTAGAKSDAA